MSKFTVQMDTKVAVSDCPVQFMHEGVTYDGSELELEGSRYTVKAGSTVQLIAACWKPDIFMALIDNTVPLVLRQASWDKLEESGTEAARVRAELQAQAAKDKATETPVRTGRRGRPAKVTSTEAENTPAE
jgi:hypothetical protein